MKIWILWACMIFKPMLRAVGLDLLRLFGARICLDPREANPLRGFAVQQFELCVEEFARDQLKLPWRPVEGPWAGIKAIVRLQREKRNFLKFQRAIKKKTGLSVTPTTLPIFLDLVAAELEAQEREKGQPKGQPSG